MLAPLDEPQSICDLIGVAFRIWRRNLPLIIRQLMLPTIIYFIASTIFQCCLSYGITPGADLGRILAASALGFISGLFYLFSLFFIAVRQLALLRLFAGFSSDWSKADAYSKKKVWWIVGLSLITGLLSSVVVGIWVCVILLSAALTGTGPLGVIGGTAGIVVGIIGLSATVLVLLLLSHMGFSLLACEDCSFFGVIGRAFFWTFKNFARVLAFGFIYFVTITVVTVPVSLPILIASVADVSVHQYQSGAASAAGDSKLSIGTMIFVQVWESFCSLLLRPAGLLCFGMFYLDLRQRVEGFDIARKLNQLKSDYGASDGIQGH